MLENAAFGHVTEVPSYMHKVCIWDFFKVDRLEYIAISKEQKTVAIKKYVHAIKNLDAVLNGEFIRDGKLSFLLIFCSFL